MPSSAIIDSVREACRQDGNIFGPAFFDQHIVVVSGLAALLARQLGADESAVRIAAYLHDLSAVRNPATLPTHARDSASLARELLAAHKFSADVQALVADAIEAHSEPLAVGAASPEAVCLSNADALSRILRPAYWLYFAYRVRKLDFDAGRQWLLSLLERQWLMLIEPARALAGRQYDEALSILRR